MSETIAIILRFREEHADEFERLFKDEVLPIRGVLAKGPRHAARGTPGMVGNHTVSTLARHTRVTIRSPSKEQP